MSRSTARSLRKRMTNAEQKLWWRLRYRQVSGCRFRRQHPIGPYVADFCCIEKRLIIEVDGSQHAVRQGKDAERTEVLNALGYWVLRYWNNDVLARTEEVVEDIRRHLLER
ncbi:MAG: endonuclease domain-containing protein [Minwuia sp.]|uniref:endonuclease domain-containing protein n=1 Tax=Minwuia sp. TaxID=2493630 RepID=UPI003A89FC54